MCFHGRTPGRRDEPGSATTLRVLGVVAMLVAATVVGQVVAMSVQQVATLMVVLLVDNKVQILQMPYLLRVMSLWKWKEGEEVHI